MVGYPDSNRGVLVFPLDGEVDGHITAEAQAVLAGTLTWRLKTLVQV